MKITFNYFAQIRQQAGVATETIDLPEATSALDALKSIDHGDAFRSLIFNESGELRPVILLIVNDVPVSPDAPLVDGNQVQIFSPVAGG